MRVPTLLGLISTCIPLLLVACGGSEEAAATGRSSLHACTAPSGYIVEGDALITPGDTRVVIMFPTSGAPATGYRVFYGTKDRVEERDLVRTAFGSASRLFAFDVAGVEYTALFPSGPNPVPGMSRLIIGDQQTGESRTLTVLTEHAGTLAPDLTLFCK